MALTFVQRNSVPSLQRWSMITAKRRARATIAFCKPRRWATVMAQAFSLYRQAHALQINAELTSHPDHPPGTGHLSPFMSFD
jgi:hypothetical protein